MPLVDPAVAEAVDAPLREAAAAGLSERVADEVPALSRAVLDEPRLRGALSDVFVPGDAKSAMLRDVVGDQVHPQTYAVFDALLARLPLVRNLRRSLEDASVLAVLVDAESRGLLGEVEDEAFRLARLLRSERDLRYALTDITITSEAKHALIDDLLGDKATPQTVALVKLIVDQARREDISERLFQLAELAAEAHDRVLAEVRCAVDLDDDRRRRLAAALSEATGRPVELKVVIDPSILGGVVARVGDEVIDGSVKRNLQQALYRLTRT